MAETIVCTECRQPFEPMKGRKGPQPVTCGPVCAVARRARLNTASRAVRPRLQRTCAVCEAPFETLNARTVTCGRACGRVLNLRLAHATRTRNAVERRARTCEACSKPFTARNPSGQARRGLRREGRFCSRRCAATARRPTFSPPTMEQPT